MNKALSLNSSADHAHYTLIAIFNSFLSSYLYPSWASVFKEIDAFNFTNMFDKRHLFSSYMWDSLQESSPFDNQLGTPVAKKATGLVTIWFVKETGQKDRQIKTPSLKSFLGSYHSGARFLMGWHIWSPGHKSFLEKKHTDSRLYLPVVRYMNRQHHGLNQSRRKDKIPAPCDLTLSANTTLSVS